MHLQWISNYSTSALHAAECLCRFSTQIQDENLRDKLGPASQALGTCLEDLDAQRTPGLWDLLEALGSKINSNSALANQLIAQSIQGFVEESLTQRLTGSITETNPLPELPEVVRLGWLVSQLSSLGFRSQLPYPPETLRNLIPIAMLAPSLAAAEVLELTRCNESIAELAIENWHIAVPPNRDVSKELIPFLMDWWETCLKTKPDWSVSIKALAHRLGLQPI